MPEARQEAEWRAEFERLGELLVYDNAKQGAIYNDEAKHQAALRWLSDQARDRQARELQILRVGRRTLIAAVAAVIVAAVGVAATLMH
jgi:hypothetical protein